VASACLVATIALAGAAALPGVGGSETDPAATLRSDGAELAARSRSAVLELYGLDPQLSSSRKRLESLHARSEALARRRAVTANRLSIARQTVTRAQRLLAGRVRALYERGSTDPLAVFLGAESLEQAMDTLDGLEVAAEQDQAIIRQSKAARGRYAALSTTLRSRSTRLARLVRDAEAEEAALEQARAERTAYIARLTRERQLTAAKLARVEAAAAAAASWTQPRALSATADQAPAYTAAPIVAGQRTLTVVASGYALPGQTATGVPSGWGVVAVDPSVIPLGTRMTIPGYGSGVASDTGPAVRGASIDLWFPTEAQAFAWGRRTVTITLD
jgi:3D (Asp-Asp-Asp) domain-containing protein